jgi:excisionase family DNA binding protein
MEQLLDLDELSKKIKVKPQTIYDWVYHKRIPFVKVGNLLRFDEGLIEQWIKKSTHIPESCKNGF